MNLGAALRFLVAVGISASITVGLPILLVDGLGLRPELAVALAMVLAFFVNFFINRQFVFRSRQGAAGQLLRFFLTNLVMRLADYLGFLLLFRVLELHYVLSLVSVLTLTTVLRFFLFQRIFAKR